MTPMTGTLHEDIYIYDHILLNSFWNKKCFRKGCRQNQKDTFYIQYRFTENDVI